MSKDAWSAEALWFQFAREGAGWLAVERCKWRTTMSSVEKCTELPRSNCDEDIISWFWNTHVECKEWDRSFGADFWGILPTVWRAAWYCTQTRLLFSVLSPCLVLCVCSDGDIRAVWNIQKQSALTRWLSLYTRLSPSQAAGPAFDCYYSWYKMPLIWALALCRTQHNFPATVSLRHTSCTPMLPRPLL